MSKKIIVIASVSIALLLIVLIAVNSENNVVETITIDLPTSEMPTDAQLKMDALYESDIRETLLVEAKYKPSKGIISVFYEDKSKMTEKLIIEIWGLPQTYHKEYECNLGTLAQNEEGENVCPNFVSNTIKIGPPPKYGWESTPVVFSVEHKEYGTISIKTEIYETGTQKPHVQFFSP